MRSIPRLCTGTVVVVNSQRPRPTKSFPSKSLWRRVFVLVCLLEVLSVASYAAGECAAVNFRVARTVSAGSNPTALAVQDFNGDGHIDMAVANGLSNDVSILLGDGAGGLGAATNYSVGSSPSSIATGDFNADGKADLVVTNFFSNNVSILLGTGTGTFTSGGTINYATSVPSGLAVGDFNGDGRSDIAVGLRGQSDRVSILLSRSAGGFTSAPPIVPGGRGYKIIAGKFNNDDILDLAIGMETKSSVFIGDGTGGFSAASLLPASFSVDAHGDFNNDGKADLVGTERTTRGISVLLGDGTGSFSAPTVFPGDSFGTGMEVGDFNGDGKIDVAVPDSRAGVLILPGDGTGKLGAATGYSLTNVGNDIVSADFNADGKLDLGVAVRLGKVTLLYGRPDGNLAAAFKFDVNDPIELVAADFNRDGKEDLAVVGILNVEFQEVGISIFLGNGTGQMARAATIRFSPSIVEFYSLVTADFDGDGRTDLAAAVTGSEQGEEIHVMRGLGNGAFARPIITGINSIARTPHTLVTGDVNRDSKADLLVRFSRPDRFATLLGTGTGNFNIQPALNLTSSGTFNTFPFSDGFAVGDFNQDANPDIVFSYFDSKQLAVLLGEGNGLFSTKIDLPLPDKPTAVAVEDFNRDGKSDLAFIATSDSMNYQLSIRLNNGVGGFGEPTNYRIGSSPQSIITKDFDGDNLIDIVITNINGEGGVSVLSGDGAGGFGLSVPFLIGSVNSAVAADFNGDGRLDLAVARDSSNDGVAILLNDPSAPRPCLSVDDATTVTEGDAGTINAAFKVTLSAASTQTVKVNYSVEPLFTSPVPFSSSISPTPGVDYQLTSGTLTFAPGTTSQTINVPINGDLTDDYDEMIALVISSPTNAAIHDSLGLGTILDNDAPPNITIDDRTVVEGNSSSNPNRAVFTVSLSAASDKRISLSYQLADGTAKQSIDYRNNPLLIVFDPGTTTRTIVVESVGDTNPEEDETFFVNLTHVSNATITDAQGQGTIIDDDAPRSISISISSHSTNEGDTGATDTSVTVQLSGLSFQTVTVNYSTADGTANAGSDYGAVSGTLTFNPGELRKLINVPIVGDTIDEIDETFGITLSGAANATLGTAQASVTIVDNDFPCSYAISPTMKTSPAAGETTTVNVTTQAACNWTAVSNSNFISVTSGASGSGSGVVSLNISANGSGAPRTGTLTIAGQTFTITQPEATPEVSTFVFDAASYAVAEGDGRVTLKVMRTGDLSGSASVNYRTVDTDSFTVSCADTKNNQGDAFARCDFATSVGRLDFLAGESQKTITVPIIDDGHAEGAETFQLALSNPVSVGVAGTPATINIQDDDAADAANPIFNTSFFVRQHYLDFLSREPEANEPWSNVLNRCPNVNNDPSCDRLLVSQSFFGSPEFRLKGFSVFRFYKLAFNRLPEYTEIVADMSFVAGATPQEVFLRKAQLATVFTQRPEFHTIYGNLSNADYVGVLFGRYSLNQITTPDPQQPDSTAKATLTLENLISQLDANALTRSQVLRAVAESDEVGAREFDNAFVAMQYYGYLRRKPEAAGYEAWLGVLRRGDIRTMVNGFMNSAEYKLRFGR